MSPPNQAELFIIIIHLNVNVADCAHSAKLKFQTGVLPHRKQDHVP